MNPSQECRCRFVITRGNAPVLLQPRKEVLNEVSFFVDMPVIFALAFARPNTGNYDLLALPQKWFDHAIMGIVGFVGNHCLCVDALKQNIRTFQIRYLPWCEMEAYRITQSVNGGMDLGAQAASAAADGLVLAPPFAPALC